MNPAHERLVAEPRRFLKASAQMLGRLGPVSEPGMSPAEPEVILTRQRRVSQPLHPLLVRQEKLDHLAWTSASASAAAASSWAYMPAAFAANRERYSTPFRACRSSRGDAKLPVAALPAPAVLVLRPVVDERQQTRSREALDQAVEQRLGLGIDPVKVLEDDDDELHLGLAEEQALDRLQGASPALRPSMSGCARRGAWACRRQGHRTAPPGQRSRCPSGARTPSRTSRSLRARRRSCCTGVPGGRRTPRRTSRRGGSGAGTEGSSSGLPWPNVKMRTVGSAVRLKVAGL